MTKGNGFTTPDVKEAMVKKKSMQKTKERYVLCDSSKFGEICSISFAEFKSARIITTKIENNEYRGIKNIFLKKKLITNTNHSAIKSTEKNV